MPYRFNNQNLLEYTSEGKRYLRNLIYPEIQPSVDDIYVITTGGDRYDKLALQFYNNVDYWWVIAAANTDVVDSLVVTPGVQLRIPAAPEKFQEALEKLNEL